MYINLDSMFYTINLLLVEVLVQDVRAVCDATEWQMCKSKSITLHARKMHQSVQYVGKSRVRMGFD
jgi:hypothetical protein